MIIELLYFLLPAAFANIMPVFVKHHFRSLAYPLDFKKKFIDEKRLLGEHKTFRGLVFGIIGAMTISLVQKYLHNYYLFNAISLINYQEINILVFGFLVGIGVIIGDALGSFVKRRVNVKPGKSLYLIDQASSIIGIGIFVLPFYLPSLEIFLYLFIIWTIGHFIIKFIGYLLKIDKNAI